MRVHLNWVVVVECKEMLQLMLFEAGIARQRGGVGTAPRETGHRGARGGH